jgi:citrate synthase
MDGSVQPAAHLVNGLRRLVDDLRKFEPQPVGGLNHVTCGQTELISFSDSGIFYCGHCVESLVQSHSFERVVWLLLNESLPTEEQLADCCAIVADSAVIDQSAIEILARIPLGARPLDLFPLCLSLLSFFDPTPQDTSVDAVRSRVWRLLSQLPLIISAGLGDEVEVSRDCRTGLTTDETELSWAGRLLSRLRISGERPSAAEDAAMNALMICECLTEMRPACFAARFAASTTSHIIAALHSAAMTFVSQLRNDPFSWTSDLLKGFRNPAQAEAWWRRREGQAMPFGFTACPQDNRATILTEICRSMLGSIDRIRIEASAARLEKLLAIEQQVPTTDWAAARLMTLLDIPSDRQALVIVMARLVGWAAQAIEQQSSGVSLLPTLRYGSLETESA